MSEPIDAGIDADGGHGIDTPHCTSERFGPRMYCYFNDNKCIYCGLPPAPLTPEQEARIEAARGETWWRDAV